MSAERKWGRRLSKGQGSDPNQKLQGLKKNFLMIKDSLYYLSAYARLNWAESPWDSG